MILKEYHRNGQNNVNINEIHKDWNEYQKYSKIVKNRAIVYAFLKGAQHSQYGHLMYDLKSQYSRNFNQYPQDLPSALSLLSTHQKRAKISHNKKTNDERINDEDEPQIEETQDEEMAFVQMNQKKEPECFLCGGNYYLPKCPLKHLLKKYRENIKDRKSTPKATVSSMFIQDDICREVEDNADEDEACDIYDFAFAQKTVTFQELTRTQKIILSQKIQGNLINPTGSFLTVKV